MNITNKNIEYVEHDGIVPAKVFYFNKEKDGPAKVVMPHWHRDIELDYLNKGHTIMTISGETREILPNTVLLINSSEVHSSYRSKIQSEEESIALLIDYDYIKRLYPQLDQFRFPTTFKEEDSLKLTGYFQKIIDISRCKNDYYNLELTGLVINIIVYLLKHCAQSCPVMESKNSREVENIRRAIRYIDEHCKEPLTLNSVADYIDRDASYFSRSFHRVTGECFKDYVTARRIDLAYNDLLYTDDSITQIAYNNGFANLKSFITSFRHYYGETPKQYLKKHSHAIPSQCHQVTNSGHKGQLIT